MSLLDDLSYEMDLIDGIGEVENKIIVSPLKGKALAEFEVWKGRLRKRQQIKRPDDASNSLGARFKRMKVNITLQERSTGTSKTSPKRSRKLPKGKSRKITDLVAAANRRTTMEMLDFQLLHAPKFTEAATKLISPIWKEQGLRRCSSSPGAISMLPGTVLENPATLDMKCENLANALEAALENDPASVSTPFSLSGDSSDQSEENQLQSTKDNTRFCFPLEAVPEAAQDEHELGEDFIETTSKHCISPLQPQLAPLEKAALGILKSRPESGRGSFRERVSESSSAELNNADCLREERLSENSAEECAEDASLAYCTAKLTQELMEETSLGCGIAWSEVKHADSFQKMMTKVPRPQVEKAPGHANSLSSLNFYPNLKASKPQGSRVGTETKIGDFETERKSNLQRPKAYASMGHFKKPLNSALF